MRNKHSAGAYYVVWSVGNYRDQKKCDYTNKSAEVTEFRVFHSETLCII